MLRDDMARYIQLRRNAGFKMTNEALMLDSFVKAAEEHGDRFVRTDRVIAWASQTPSEAHRHRRLSAVRHLAQALQAEDDQHQVPPRDVFGRGKRQRPPPYIFSPQEITKLNIAS